MSFEICVCAFQEEMLSLYLNNCLVWAVVVCIFWSIVIATDFHQPTHWVRQMSDAVLLQDRYKRLFVLCPLLTRVPSVTWLWIFVTELSTIYHFMHVLLVPRQTQHLSSRKPEERIHYSIFLYLLKNNRINSQIPMQNILEPDMTTELVSGSKYFCGENIWMCWHQSNLGQL